ncbi:cysteine synthase family protein [Dyella jejuensis]|uniref:cysteine synthase n=2 Tax=Dyella jejuensis TaxID=1432009 RepID=A0ABW8JQ57_9GAMM
MDAQLQGIASLIGHTPMLSVTGGLVPPGKELILKLEGFNPSLSVKDRTALGLVLEGFRSGHLRKGGTLIESTSGNLGKALAMLGASLKFKVVVVVDPKISKATATMYSALGAEMIVVDRADEAGGFQKNRIKAVKEYLEQHPDAYWPNQYDNESNPLFHYNTTAVEILRSERKFDALVGAVSTGGHLSGIARRIKKERPSITIVACDSVGSAVFKNSFAPYLINGIGLGWRSANLDFEVMDRYCLVSDQQAISTCLSLARSEGLLIGGSGGAVVFTALNHLYKSQDKSTLALIPDSGINYLDQIFDEKWREKNSVHVLGESQLLDELRQSAATECVPVGAEENECVNTLQKV